MSASVDAAPMLVSVEEAARLLSVSTRTVHRLVHEGQLPYVRVGRRLLLSVASLEDWIVRHEIKSVEEVA